MSLQEMRNNTLTNIVELNKNENTNMLTDEKNLTISKGELIQKVKEINPAYLEVMETESNIFVRQGLFNGYSKDSGIYFDIPDWNRFISAINAFYVACYLPEESEKE